LTRKAGRLECWLVPKRMGERSGNAISFSLYESDDRHMLILDLEYLEKGGCISERRCETQSEGGVVLGW
jgi:hypothetical protein